MSLSLSLCIAVCLSVCLRMSVLISLWLHSSASLYTSIFQLVRRPSSSGGPVTGCSYSASSGHSRPIRPDHLPITHTKTTEPYTSCLAVSAPPSALRGCVWWRDARRHATAACLSNEPRQRNPQIVTFHGIMQLEIRWLTVKHRVYLLSSLSACVCLSLSAYLCPLHITIQDIIVYIQRNTPIELI